MIEKQTPPFHTEQLTTREEWQQKMLQKKGVGASVLSNVIEPFGVHDLSPDDLYDVLDDLMAHELDDADYETMELHISDLQSGELDLVPTEGNAFTSERNVELKNPRDVVLADAKVRAVIDRRDLSEHHEWLVSQLAEVEGLCRKGIQAGIEQGYIPATVLGRLDHAFRGTSVRLFDAVLLGLHDKTFGFYNAEQDEIGIRHDLKDDGLGLEDVYVHELIHAISGGSFITAKDAEAPERNRTGFFQNGGRQNPLNEAITQHIALGVLTGDFATLNPDKRHDGNTLRYEYRKILAGFVDRSKGLIGLQTLTNAMFEDTEPGRDVQLRRSMTREVRDAYGIGALTKLAKLMDSIDFINTDQIEELVISRIHAPELDEQGKVVKKGFIDIENLPSLFNLPTKT